jgi:hypothetical protein
MRIPITLVVLGLGAVMLQGCVAATAAGAAVGAVAGVAVGGAVKVTAEGVGAAGRAVTGGHKKHKDSAPPPETEAPPEPIG